ncbi:MAG: tetratricopeptide repeat protein [Candidatus Omnitrophota bacterium]
MQNAFMKVIFFCLFIIFLSLNLLFASTVNDNTSSAYAHFTRASIYEKFNKLDEAIEEYKEALKYDYSSVDIHIRLGLVYVKRDRIDEAIDEFVVASNLSPERMEPHLLLALLYGAKGDFLKAAKEYEIVLNKASQVEPENIEIKKALGEVYFRQGKLDEALDVYKGIATKAPEDKITHFLLGSIYLEKNLLPDAANEFKEAIRIDPDFHQALNSLGFVYIEEGKNFNEAEVLIKKALSFEPKNGAYLDSLGWLNYKKAQYKEAINILEEAKIFLADPLIFDHLGDAYFKDGQVDKAREAWLRALELNPNQIEVKEKINTLEK